jgi:hypothetical protein
MCRWHGGFGTRASATLRSLYYGTDVETLELMYPDSKFMREVSGELGRADA